MKTVPVLSGPVLAHATFLAVAIGLAFFAWTHEEKDADEGIVLLDIEQHDFTRVAFTWPKGELELSFDGDGKERTPVARLVHEVTKKKPKADERTSGEAKSDENESGEAKSDEAKSDEAKSDEAKPEEEVTERETTSFPAGTSVRRSLEKLAPLTVRRSLGVPDEERLKTMGLDAPERKLVVEAGKKRVVLEIGAETYGNQGRYARLEGQSEVWLLESGAVSGLEGTPFRLMESRLIGAELGDVVEVSVRAGERSASFVHVDREQPKKRYFAPKGSESERSEEASGLIATLRSLRAKRFVDEPLPADANEAAKVSFRLADERAIELVVYELSDGGYRAKVGRWLAELTPARGKNVVEDIGAVLPAP